MKDKLVSVTMLRQLKLTSGARYLEFTNAARSKLERHNSLSHKTRKLFDELKKFNFQAVEMPLQGGLSFTIFEPLEYSTAKDNKLSKLVTALLTKQRANDETNLSKVLSLLRSHGPTGVDLDLKMPKFWFEEELDLKEILQSIGLRRAFIEGAAEFSKTMSRHNVYISDVKHQALIDVNEKGIKPAGSTKVVLQAEKLHISKSDTLIVTIKRPFMFLIRHIGIPLFVGQLTRLYV